ncbi:MAG TPA: hypothetical protein PK297_14725, partial [Spirochaetota bacterium]|nr:hypothetical protein [Spirochaetota bacterium]
HRNDSSHFVVTISLPELYELYLTQKLGYRIIASNESNFILKSPLSKDDKPMANNSISALYHFNCCTNRPIVGRLFNLKTAVELLANRIDI